MYKLKEKKELLKTKRMEVSKVIYQDRKGIDVIEHVIINSKPSIATIVKSQDNLVFIKQFRSTTGEFYIEIPGGLIEDGESILEAAKREVLEETGLIVSNLKLLTHAPNLLDPSKSDEDYQYAIGEVKEVGLQKLDKMEIIMDELIYLKENEVYERLLNTLKEGTPFYDNLYITGHSAMALLIYFFLK